MAPFMTMAALVFGDGGRERTVDEIVAAGPPGARMALLARVRAVERAARRGAGLAEGVWRMGEPGVEGRG